jgi:hypothetical protein
MLMELLDTFDKLLGMSSESSSDREDESMPSLESLSDLDHAGEPMDVDHHAPVPNPESSILDRDRTFSCSTVERGVVDRV